MKRARRRHPYFSRINRLEEACKVAPGKSRRAIPAAAPECEPGVLWDEFRSQE